MIPTTFCPLDTIPSRYPPFRDKGAWKYLPNYSTRHLNPLDEPCCSHNSTSLFAFSTMSSTNAFAALPARRVFLGRSRISIDLLVSKAMVLLSSQRSMSDSRNRTHLPDILTTGIRFLQIIA